MRRRDEPLLDVGLLGGCVLIEGPSENAFSFSVSLATHLGLGEDGRRQLDHVALKLGGLRVGLLQQSSGLVVEGSHVAHVCEFDDGLEFECMSVDRR